MAEQIDKEVEAIKAVLTALEPLSPAARSSVLEYVVKRLQVPFGMVGGPANVPTTTPVVAAWPQRPASEQAVEVTHIKQFKEQKKPASANEMASLVAYYLAEIAPASERKKTINAKDIETHFKIAGYPLSEHIRMTLPNAKAAGYFDAVGDGEYRLNAVGHNLVVHSMPRGGATAAASPRKRKKRPESNAK